MQVPICPCFSSEKESKVITIWSAKLRSISIVSSTMPWPLCWGMTGTTYIYTYANYLETLREKEDKKQNVPVHNIV